jgi:hypothetical protein
MRRTQLYLDDEMSRLLTAESRRRGTTISALVREAVAAAYGRNEGTDRPGIIDRLAGVWADREDIGLTEPFVRELRRSRRPERWTHRVGAQQPDTHHAETRAAGGKVSPRQRRHH